MIGGEDLFSNSDEELNDQRIAGEKVTKRQFAENTTVIRHLRVSFCILE